MYKRIIISLLIPLMAGCGSENPPMETADQIRPAVLITVGENTADSFLSYPAVIEGETGSELAFSVSGVVKDLNVRSAQAVEQGEVLARLDQRDFQSKLESAQATYKNAEKEYQRALRLIEGNAIARNELQRRKTTLDTAGAQLNMAKKALSDTVIVAPFAGHVSKVSIEELQTAQAGKTVITMLNLKQPNVKTNLPANVLAQFKRYSEFKNTFFVTLDVAPDRPIPAILYEISLEADAATQTYETIFKFPPPDDILILPGMNAEIQLKDPGKAMNGIRISVPMISLGVDDDQRYVWVVDKETMTVSKRTVTIEQGVGSELNTLSGLTSGETIVGAGIDQLSEGMQVRRWSKR